MVRLNLEIAKYLAEAEAVEIFYVVNSFIHFINLNQENDSFSIEARLFFRGRFITLKVK